jgi:hypothetical protein
MVFANLREGRCVVSVLIRAVRWPPTISVLIAWSVELLLPHRYPFLPPGLSTLTVSLLGVLALVAIVAHVLPGEHFERIVTIVLFCVVTLVTLLAVASLVYRVVIVADDHLSGIALLQASIAAWILNVLAFAQWYWLLDTDGTSRARDLRPDFLFPQRGLETIFPQFQPTYADYLALAFTTATAFSPTDVLPTSARAKGLMVVEAALSLVVISISAARAVGALG